jgi:hypothetical protein
MKTTLVALAFAVGLASPVLAANARHPYQNIDRRNDAGNPTGDDQVERLNQQQLGGNPTQPAPMPGSQQLPPR